MNYIDFLKDLTPFIDKGLGYYFLNSMATILAISSILMLYFCFDEFRRFKKTNDNSRLYVSLTSGLFGVVGVVALYIIVAIPTNDIPKLKEVRIDNKENIEFYKTIIRNPYYQKMDDSDKTAVYVLTFNGIICGDNGCLNNAGEPLLVHKNFALTYAIEKTLRIESVKLSRDFGKVATLSDVAYQGLEGLSYNGISYEYEKVFKEFLEKTPKANEAIENAKQAYRDLEATYGTEWK